MTCNIFRIAFLLSAHVIFTSCSPGDDSLVVETSCGRVRGRLQPVVHGLSVRQFLGIPYAQPPLGQLRFARPQPAKPWQGERAAVEFGFACPQDSLVPLADAWQSTIPLKDDPQSEDCLFLDVYTPSYATAHDKKAVMVWIHGGGFSLGSGMTYNPSAIVALYDVIAVTINYRLGVLGFFNVPGTEMKGNYGMHDQVLALKWVQQNIAKFGGDPNKVTIYGESAGGMSVSLHLLSPLSEGLFHRVIAQSGSSASTFIGAKVKSTTALETFLNALNCNFNDRLLDCLRSKSMSELIPAQHDFLFPAVLRTEDFATVVVDGEFLPDDPRKLLKEGKFHQVDVMTGVTGNEGALAATMDPARLKHGVDVKSLEQLVRHYIPLTANQNEMIEDATLFEYTDSTGLENRTKNRQITFDIIADTMFIAPAVLEASALVKANRPVYFYVYAHAPHFCPAWLGAVHLVELYSVFGVPLYYEGLADFFKVFDNEFSDLEVGLSQYTMQMWTNFAKHGDPNIGGSLPVTWPRYNSSGHVHLRISLKPKVEYSLREKKIAFWNEFVPKLNSDGRPGQDGSGSDNLKKDERVKSEL